MYPDDFDVFYEWPRYSALNDQETPEAVEHLRNQYSPTLSMADKWMGKLLDEIVGRVCGRIPVLFLPQITDICWENME